MSMFGTHQADPSMGSERVLAYLLEVQRTGAPLRIADAGGREVPATFDLISEQRATLTLFGPLDVDLGAETYLAFILEGLRYKAPTRVLALGAGSAAVDLPKVVEPAERRKASRATLSAREGMAAMAMAGLFNPLATRTLEAAEPSQVFVADTAEQLVPIDEPPPLPLPEPGLIKVQESAQSLALRTQMPWTSQDVASDATLWTTQVVDWLKARHITLNGRANALVGGQDLKTPAGHSLVYANHDSLLHVSAHNPFLGQSPVARKFNGGLLSHGITYTFLSRALPESWHQTAKLNSVKLEAFCTGNSIHFGLRIK